jgi:S1-C subfamily serine protease
MLHALVVGEIAIRQAQLNLPVSSGVIIVDVKPGGPAESAGVKINDIVLAIDGKQIRSS